MSRGMAMDHGTVQEGSQAMAGQGINLGVMGAMPGMGEKKGGMMGQMRDMPGMAGMSMDLNDFEIDANVANDRTLDDPEIVQFENGGRVLLLVVNAFSMTVFWIDTGEMGARERSGIVLAPSGAAVSRLALLSETDRPAFSSDLAQELALRAANPLPDRVPDLSHMVILAGAMMPYVWTINGQTWGSHTPIAVKSGQRVEVMFHNMSMMAHPMHLHGHVFQVVGVNGQRFDGAMRDTLHVPAMGSVTIAFDAGEIALWMLNCRHVAHMATGMMTELGVQSASVPFVSQRSLLTVGALENLFHPFLNETYTAEVMDMRRMREEYPEAYAHIASRRLNEPKLRRRLFAMIVALELLVTAILWIAVMAHVLAIFGVAPASEALALGLIGTGLFTSIWAGFLVAGNYFCY